MNRQKSHRCSSSDGSLFYIVLNYSSTAACAAANILAIMLVINYLRLDWSTFELHFSCILHVLHVDVSYYFVRIFIILQNIQFFFAKISIYVIKSVFI